MSAGFDIVVAADDRMGIGKAGALPWRLPADMAHFKSLTQTAPPGSRNAVIMGRATWESIPDRFRPLPGRQNIVLSRRPDFQPPGEVIRAGDLDAALATLGPDIHRAFVIGGGQVYREALGHPRCQCVYLTRIAGDFECDVTLPELPAAFALAEVLAEGEQNGLRYRIERWARS